MNASKLIDEKIASLGDWRGKTLAEVRRIVHEAVPEAVEEWKWMGTPTWSRGGILCIANAHKETVQVVFAKGASLPDKDKLFNAMLDGGTWRAIKFFEGDKINEGALKNLIRAADAFNMAKSTGKKSAGGKKGPSKSVSKKVRLAPRSRPSFVALAKEDGGGGKKIRRKPTR